MRIRLDTRLVLAIPFVVLLVILLLFGIAIARLGRAWQIAQLHIKINDRVRQFDHYRLQTRRFEKDFLLFYRIEGLKKAEDLFIKQVCLPAVDEMKKILTDIAELNIKLPAGQKPVSTDKLLKLCQDYRLSVKEAVQSVYRYEAKAVGTADEIYASVINQPEILNMRSKAGAVEAELQNMLNLTVVNADASTENVNKAMRATVKFTVVATVVLIIVFIISTYLFLFLSKKRGEEWLKKVPEFNKKIESLKGLFERAQYSVAQFAMLNKTLYTSSTREVFLATEQEQLLTKLRDMVAKVYEITRQMNERLRDTAHTFASAEQILSELRGRLHASDTMAVNLGESMHKIVKIVRGVDSNAEQLNILAVNAAIEASRAEDNASGFRRIADSMRELTETTEKSTKDITELMDNVHKEMDMLNGALTDIKRYMDEEAIRLQESYATCQEISSKSTQGVENAKLLVDAIDRIENTMRMATSLAKDVEDSVDQLNKIAADLESTTAKIKII
ncbi:MAG: methyl-accepting chemotaxis protein [Candidatus Omnitrophica bacterium]|nr:methyl-accepting chemotaxis protein [Candidatus Omnitrophota bacterium]